MQLFYEEYLGKCQNIQNIKLSYCLNDDGDCLVRI